MWRIVLEIKLNFKCCVLAFYIFLFLGYKRDASLGQRVRGGGSDWKTLSVTAMPCHLSRKGEALARAKSLWFIGQLLLSLTNEGETCWFCQGFSLRKTSPGRGKMSPVGDKKGN